MEACGKKEGLVEACSGHGSKKRIPHKAKIYCVILVIVPFSTKSLLNYDVNTNPAYVTKKKVKSVYRILEFGIT